MRAHIVSREAHPISRKDISENALKVLYRLHKNGYEAYLVGGGVRDLLLGKHPKDFDIATNAHPEQVKQLFRNCRLIGRRFRLAHILFGREVIEVATFRGHHGDAEAHLAKQDEAGQLLRDNVYGTLEEDAERRDFTVNALYYNIADFSIYDFAGGLADLEARQLRMIGDVESRYREDPVRMLRAVRFAAKLQMEIAPETEAPIHQLADLLGNIPPARLFEEILKLFLAGDGLATLRRLQHYGLLAPLFPGLAAILHQQPGWQVFIEQALADTDTRIQQEKRVSPAYLLAALLWPQLQRQLAEYDQMAPLDAMNHACSTVLEQQSRHIAIPRRFAATIRDIWVLQLRLPRRGGRRAQRLLEHPKFSAGLDFLKLRAQCDQNAELDELCQWWSEFAQSEQPQRQSLLKNLDGKSTEPRKSRGQRSGKGRRRRRPKREQATHD